MGENNLKEQTETTDSYEMQDHGISQRRKAPKKNKEWCTKTLSKVTDKKAEKT
jgi:hypothetical protein